MYTIAVSRVLTAWVAGIVNMKLVLIPYGLVLLSPCKSRVRILCRKKAHLFRNTLRIVKKCIDCIVEVIIMSL